jgi:hypothetical protein
MIVLVQLSYFIRRKQNLSGLPTQVH